MKTSGSINMAACELLKIFSTNFSNLTKVDASLPFILQLVNVTDAQGLFPPDFVVWKNNNNSKSGFWPSTCIHG